jgi:hypothetical protein
MRWTLLVLPVVGIALLILGLLDARYDWTRRWARRSEQGNLAGRHRPAAGRLTLDEIHEACRRRRLEAMEHLQVIRWSPTAADTQELAPVVGVPA